MTVFDNIAALKAAKGNSLTSPEWFHVTQDLVNEFAHCTKDFQWIHVDPEKAKMSPFGGPIAHGFYSLSLLSMFIEQTMSVKSAKMGVNYGLNKVRFPHHVPVGCNLRCVFTIDSVEDYPNNGAKATWAAKVEIEGIDKPACVAEFVTLMFE